MGSPYSKRSYQRARAEVLAGSPMCIHCGKRKASEADHQPPLSMHEHVDGTGCCMLVPSCHPCARKQGGQVGKFTAPVVLPSAETVSIIEPEGFAVDSEVWDVPWLTKLRKVPKDATWPRLMSVPHPRAVGSLGPEVAKWAAARRGRPWRWWQTLAATRLFEIDANGELVWELAVLTVARQLGKTWWLGDICGWRQESDHFHDEQLVLSTGKDVSVCREMQRSSRLRAKQRKDEYRVREVNGQEEIEFLSSGSRWMVRAKEAVFGITASMVTVDEAWKVAASVVDEGVVPTMVEQNESQLLLVSTAHRKATALMIGRRASAFAELGTGHGSLLVEWSAPPHCELTDRDGWRQASPHWTDKRERWIAERLDAAQGGESDDVDEPDPLAAFRCQWLNQWPAKRTATAKGEVLIEPEEWEFLSGPVESSGERVYIGVEDYYGQGAAVVAVVPLDDGLLGVDGWTCETWEEAMRDVKALVRSHKRYRLHVGVTAASRVPTSLRVIKSGSNETRIGLSTLRELVSQQRIVHDATTELDSQIRSVRVTRASVGLQMVGGVRSDIVRALAWSAHAAAKPVRVPAIA